MYFHTSHLDYFNFKFYNVLFIGFNMKNHGFFLHRDIISFQTKHTRRTNNVKITEKKIRIYVRQYHNIAQIMKFSLSI